MVVVGEDVEVEVELREEVEEDEEVEEVEEPIMAAQAATLVHDRHLF